MPSRAAWTLMFVFCLFIYLWECNRLLCKKKPRGRKKLATGAGAEAAPAAPPLVSVSSYVLSDIEQPAAVPDPSEDVKVACV